MMMWLRQGAQQVEGSHVVHHGLEVAVDPCVAPAAVDSSPRRMPVLTSGTNGAPCRCNAARLTPVGLPTVQHTDVLETVADSGVDMVTRCGTDR